MDGSHIPVHCPTVLPSGAGVLQVAGFKQQHKGGSGHRYGKLSLFYPVLPRFTFLASDPESLNFVDELIRAKLANTWNAS